MMRLLQWLFVGHLHKWRTLSSHTLVNGKNEAFGVVYVQQCEHCGTVRRKDLK